MLCTFVYRESITADLHVEHVEWAATDLTGDLGSSHIFVPRDSEVFDLDEDGYPRYLDDEDSSYVEILHPTAGRWVGVVDIIGLDAPGGQIEAVAIEAWLEARKLVVPRVFEQAPAGLIVDFAIRDAVAGLGHAVISPGGSVLANPTIERYEFTGQSLLDCLSDLHEVTGQEWEISEGRLYWLGHSGVVHEFWLIEEGDLIAATRSSHTRDRTAEVVARDGFGQTLRVGNPETSPFWPRQEVINTR